MTNTERMNEGKVKLQGIHAIQTSKKAKDLLKGDIIKWNFGYTSTVVDVYPSTSGKMYTYVTRDENGKTFARKTTADRLFAIKC